MEKRRTKSVWGVSALAYTMLMLLFMGNVEYAFAAVPDGSLDPTSVPKFVAPLVKPPVFPRKGKIKMRGMKNAEYYEIAVRQFQQLS